jgi:hypothetical protein
MEVLILAGYHKAQWFQRKNPDFVGPQLSDSMGRYTYRAACHWSQLVKARKLRGLVAVIEDWCMTKQRARSVGQGLTSKVHKHGYWLCLAMKAPVSWLIQYAVGVMVVSPRRFIREGLIDMFGRHASSRLGAPKNITSYNMHDSSAFLKLCIHDIQSIVQLADRDTLRMHVVYTRYSRLANLLGYELGVCYT